MVWCFVVIGPVFYCYRSGVLLFDRSGLLLLPVRATITDYLELDCDQNIVQYIEVRTRYTNFENRRLHQAFKGNSSPSEKC